MTPRVQEKIYIDSSLFRQNNLIKCFEYYLNLKQLNPKTLPQKKGEPSVSLQSTKNTLTVTQKPAKQAKEVKLAYSTRALDKQKKEMFIDRLSQFVWEEILCFCINDIESLTKFSRVCKKFYNIISGKMGIWKQLLRNVYKKELVENPEFKKLLDERELKLMDIIQFVKKQEAERAIKCNKLFYESFNKLFEYGHIKENISTKLIEKLKLRVDFSLNKSRKYYSKYIENHPYKMKIENNFTHILLNIPRVQEIKFDESLEQLEIDIIFKSLYLKKQVTYNYILKKKELYDLKRSTKAFHYFPIKNFLFVYFDDDNKVLYMLYEISVLELIRGFERQLAKSIKGTKKFKPVIYDDLEEKIKAQLDYEAHISIQNHEKTLFTFVDTRLYPNKFDKNRAHFKIPVNLKFSCKNSPFKLDDGQGINQILPDFFFIDSVLKDKDNILVIFSGLFQAIEIKKSDYSKYIENSFEYGEENFRLLGIEYKDPTQNFMAIMMEDSNKKEILVFYIEINIFSTILKEL